MRTTTAQNNALLCSGHLLIAPIVLLSLGQLIGHGLTISNVVDCQKLSQNSTLSQVSSPVHLLHKTQATLTTTTTNGHKHRHQHQQEATIVDVKSSTATVDGQQQSFENHLQEPSLSSSMLRTFIRTNNMRVYHLDLHSYAPDFKFAGDPQFVDSTSDSHKTRCATHLKQFDNSLKLFKQADPAQALPSANILKLADSYGRPQAGLLLGNQFWLGSFETCTNLKNVIVTDENADDEQQQLSEAQGEPSFSVNKSVATVDGQYCIGVVQFPNWNAKDSKTSVKVGLCLPDTCTTSMINENEQLLSTVERMMKYQFDSESPYSRMKLRQVYCLPHETSQARQFNFSARLFLFFMGSLVALCIVATIIDCSTKKSIEKNQFKVSKERNWRTIFVDSFSIVKNFNKFTHVRSSKVQQTLPQVDSVELSTTNTHQNWPSKDQSVESSNEDCETFDRDLFFNSIAGLKCIGLFWIICAHTFLVGITLGNNLITADKLTGTYLANVWLAAHLMVDTFFAISGMLASYLMFESGIQKLTASKYVVLTVHRYWRLTPVYLICYWFTKSVGLYTSFGPLWDYGTAETSPRLNCYNESWLAALLYTSDFKSPKDHCVPFAWFIANGIKFWLVTPILLAVVYKSVKRGYTVIAAIIFASTLLVGKLAFDSNVDIKSVVEFRPESADDMLNNMGEVYTRPYSRIGAYLIGLLAGHFMYMINTKQLKLKLSKNTKLVCWTLFSLCTGLLMFLVRLAGGVELDEQIMPYVFSISSALMRPIWALCTCWLVFALANGQAKWLSSFLSATCWQILVKLSFCAYLFQGEVIAQLFFTETSSVGISYKDMTVKPIVAIFATVVASVVLTLIVEMPMIGIEELLLPRKHDEKQQTKAAKSIDNLKNSVECNVHDTTHNGIKLKES